MLGFVRARGFGTLAVNAPDGPLLAHVPVLPDAAGDTVDLHLVRSNPILALDLPCPAVISVTGPDAYVSPDWYGAPDQVPTWNYVAVHLRGTLARLPQEDMRDMLDRQSAAMEAMHDKRPWTTGKMDPCALDRMMRAIAPCRMTVDRTDGTWKLNQNKPDALRLAAAAQVSVGSEVAEMARLMRDPPA